MRPSAPPRCEVPVVAHPRRKTDQVGGRAGEEEPALAVQVAGHGVERDHQPRGEAAELLGGRADPAVRHRGWRRGESAGELADFAGGNAGPLRHPLRRESRRRLAQGREPVGERSQVPQVRAPFLEQDMEDREQEQGVGARADGEVLVRLGRRLGAAGIHHHQLAAALPQLVQPARDSARRHQAAVRGARIGAEHEEEAGPVDVGHRQEELVAEHLQGREHVRELVDRGGGESGARSQRAGEERDAEHRRVGVDAGVPQVERHRAPAVLPLHRRQPLAGLVESRVPGDGAPPLAFAPLGLPDAVGIALHVGDRRRLGADVPAAERVVRVATDALHRGAVHLDGETAHGFAQHAGVEPGRHRRGSLARANGRGVPFRPRAR